MEKEQKYSQILPSIRALVQAEPDQIARMANIAAILHAEFGFWWTGFYRVDGTRLVLGPFQGPLACMSIPYGRGVCGAAWQRAETVIVPDVHQFPGHIACSSQSLSEIVVPVFRNGEVCAVLDIDSDRLATFDQTDALYLSQITALI